MLFRVLCTFSAGLLMAQTAADPSATARKALDLLLAGKYADVHQMFTADLQKSITEDALAKVGAQIKGFGALNKLDDPMVQKSGTNTVVVFPAHFEKQNLNFRFIVNQAGQVAGMFMLPGEVSWQRPSYSKPDSFHERDVTIGDDQWKLPGTLTLPNGAGPFPGVVLVHGSGPNDRDESVGGTKVFRDLAEGLASRGIAVLRYEKRTRQYSTKMAGLHGLTVDEETVEDAARASAVLRGQKEVNPQKVYVVGHSLGGYVAPRIAAEDGKLAGLVLLAANARPIEDLVVEQAEYLGIPQRDLDGIKAQAKRVKQLEAADIDAPALLGMPVSYLLDLKTYDPVASAKKLTIPILVLQGERDFQVTMKDFTLWKTGLADRKDVTFKSFPSLNHLFVAGEGKGTEAEYRKPGHVAPEAVDAIANWVSK
jgi:dienelactone hydrolase